LCSQAVTQRAFICCFGGAKLGFSFSQHACCHAGCALWSLFLPQTMPAQNVASQAADLALIGADQPQKTLFRERLLFKLVLAIRERIF
jgi:hypothetical protein